MLHYLFTNDLRISKLEESLQRAGQCFVTDTVPSAAENKSENNNMMTLGFYFNLNKDSNCAKLAKDGKIRTVVLNFIKKFQFPNPRTMDSFNDAINDKICIAPLRLIIQTLYYMLVKASDQAYITRDEITKFIFFNYDVAQTTAPDISNLIKQIVDYRKNNILPSNIETDENNIVWLQCERQVREMIKILTWAGCISEDADEKYTINHSDLSIKDKADLFDIVIYNEFWEYKMFNTLKEARESYHAYMDCDIDDGAEDANADDGLIDAEEQKENFRQWFRVQLKKKDSKLYKKSTISSYIKQMEKGYETFEKYDDYNSPFQIQDSASLKEYTNYLFEAEGFDKFNKDADNKACECGFKKYYEFLLQGENNMDLVFEINIDCDKPRNRIIFGAPGTGKSYTLKNETKEFLDRTNGEYERVTFHPDYSYANFVGTYKPVSRVGDNGEEVITYTYVPGPFMRILVKALRDAMQTTEAHKPYVLIIEEINRANVAAVFGDVFQLLDRDDSNCSEYEIEASEDIKKYLSKELNVPIDKCSKLKIPNNMFIWATMNSADQGVFPMDTAFKRRWDFTYLGIDDSEAGIVGKKVVLGQGEYRRVVEWNALRKPINSELLSYKVNEDKLMGPYFISEKHLPEGEKNDATDFIRVFKNKVIMYLFDDAAKQKRIMLFGGCDEKAKNQYSKICSEFDTKGVHIFCEAISDQFIDNVPEDDGE